MTYFRVLLDKTEGGAELSVEAKFCKTDDLDDCVVKVTVLDRALMPLPVCQPDGSVFFPKGRWWNWLKTYCRGVEMLKKCVRA